MRSEVAFAEDWEQRFAGNKKSRGTRCWDAIWRLCQLRKVGRDVVRWCPRKTFSSLSQPDLRRAAPTLPALVSVLSWYLGYIQKTPDSGVWLILGKTNKQTFDFSSLISFSDFHIPGKGMYPFIFLPFCTFFSVCSFQGLHWYILSQKFRPILILTYIFTMASLLRSIKSFWLFKVALKLYTKIVNCFFLFVCFSVALWYRAPSNLTVIFAPGTHGACLKEDVRSFKKATNKIYELHKNICFFSRLLIFLFWKIWRAMSYISHVYSSPALTTRPPSLAELMVYKPSFYVAEFENISPEIFIHVPAPCYCVCMLWY